MPLIDELKREEQLLVKQLEVIRAAIQVYSGNIDSPVNDGDYFPTKASTEKQLLWIFQNKISQGLKLREVQEIYNQLKGKDDVKIQNTARRMKKEGKLILVKYNDQNQLSFWGLPNWVGIDDFLDKHKPNMDSLPLIESSVIYKHE